jgi:hypothetical protein
MPSLDLIIFSYNRYNFVDIIVLEEVALVLGSLYC